MKLYTKTGDSGLTSLNDGKRVKKNAARVETYGTVDELNAIIGIARSFDLPSEMEADFEHLSLDLFNLGSDIATRRNADVKFKVVRIEQGNVDWLERKIDEYDEKLPTLTHFILPGGTKAAAFLHQARTVCRRAERLAISLSESEDIGEFVVIYLNRLSDYLFVAARLANFYAGKSDILWKP